MISSRPDSATQRGSGGDDGRGAAGHRRPHPIQTLILPRYNQVGLRALNKHDMFQTAMPRGRNDSSSSYDTMESQTEDGFSSQGDEVDHQGANQANSRVTDFNARQRRIDQKQVTLELDKSSKDLYFSKLIKDGEISKEGRDALRDKYYVSPEMYEAWQPPQLEDTKLYFLAPKKNRDSVDAGLLSIHGRSLFRQIEHYLDQCFRQDQRSGQDRPCHTGASHQRRGPGQHRSYR